MRRRRPLKRQGSTQTPRVTEILIACAIGEDFGKTEPLSAPAGNAPAG
jgi:hypothetical protein